LPPSVPRAGAVTQNAYMQRDGRQRYSPTCRFAVRLG
jgi:hypothetical protein